MFYEYVRPRKFGYPSYLKLWAHPMNSLAEAMETCARSNLSCSSLRYHVEWEPASSSELAAETTHSSKKSRTLANRVSSQFRTKAVDN